MPRTATQAGNIIPAEITIFTDSSFSFKTKTPPASDLLKKAAGVPKGSGNPLEPVGTVNRSQVREIAEAKMKDLNAVDIEGAMLQIEGSARSMGLTVVED